MSLCKRRFIGELTKKDLTKKLVAGGVIISILLAVWMFLPGVIDMMFGGSRGGYDTHAERPTVPGTYNLDPIEFDLNIDFDPSGLSPEMVEWLMDMLGDLINPEDIDIETDFSDFDLSNFNIPIFYIRDNALPSGYPEYMRQNAYDTISADGTSWIRENDNENVTTDYVYSNPIQYREITFILNGTESIEMRLPFFPYNPRYVDNSMQYVGNFSSYTIPDDGVLYEDMYETIEMKAYGLPSYTEPTNFTYRITNDYSMPISLEDEYKDGLGSYGSLTPAAANLYSSYADYMQIPGINASRIITSYLNTHPSFATAFTNLSATFDKASNPTHEILNGIVDYLYDTYDMFTTFPERPGDGQDMIEWFLSRPKTIYPNEGGLPYDFAAAFTMLARAFDIPTRLVTGYYDWDGDGIVSVYNVYAWAEAYLPETNPSYNDWIDYDFVPMFDSTEITPEILTDFIVVDNPAMGQTFTSTTGIPLNMRMYSNMTITNITYSVDGGANQSVFSLRQPIPLLTGGYFLNTSFNVSSWGMHEIQAFMTTANGVVSSMSNTFVVNPPTGDFVSVDSPVNNSVTNSTTIVLDYTAVNASTITGASFSVFYVNNGTAVISIAPIAPLASQVTSFTLTANGTFRIVITIDTELGPFDSQSTLGSILFSRNPPNLLPDAWFYPSSSTVVPGQNVVFTHSGSNGDGPATYQWDFGDGTANSTLENPTHVYSTTGIYNVTLTVTDANGDVSTVTWTYAVTVVPNTIPDPVVVVNATRILPGQSIWFNHTGSPGDPPYNRSWDFGDGFTAGNFTPVVHQYTAEGNYTAYLTITDGNGDTRTSVPIAIVVSWDLYPTAFFRANGSSTPMFIASGNSVQFTHTGSNGDAPATYQWDFGDGTANDTSENPLHQYTVPGSHTVTLTVNDTDGDQHTYHWAGCINVDVYATTLTVDFTPKYIEIFQNITISGNLEYINGTGIGGQNIDLRIEYWLGNTLQSYNTTAAVTAAGTGLYQISIQVLMSSDFIRVIATFAGTSILLSSTAQVLG